MIPICFSFLFPFFFPPINRAPIKQEVKHSSSSSFSSTTHPLLIFKYFGDQAVRSIAEETLFRTILTQTCAYAQVAEAKNLTKTRLASAHHHRKESAKNMMGLTLQLESVGCCYWGGGKSVSNSFPWRVQRKGMSPVSTSNLLILLNRSEKQIWLP